MGYFEVNQKSGWRWNTSKAFLRPARNRANLVIWTEAQVERLLIEPGPQGQKRCGRRPSRGSVRIRSKHCGEAPAIALNYLSTEEDREIAADSIRQIRTIVSQQALAKYQPVEWKPGIEFQSDAELAKLAGDIANTIFHPVGTTRMGHDGDGMAVVDSRLRVRGMQGLRVVDAGIMPSITSGNTNAPTLMIAEKAARMILREAQGRA